MFSQYVLLFPNLQIEGRGNGIKTNIVNNIDIAKALERPPECKSLCNSSKFTADHLFYYSDFLITQLNTIMYLFRYRCPQVLWS
jgi:hypothetical protein